MASNQSPQKLFLLPQVPIQLVGNSIAELKALLQPKMRPLGKETY